jgi:flavin reductase (DIM6/NTAB) family NADH-FMN oxidoreductase RutF
MLTRNEEASVEIPASNLNWDQTYKLMTGAIVPRPIAWVTTCSPDGVVNAAPFSAFTLLSQDPPIVLFQAIEGEREKDTARNIRLTGEFVVNIPNLPLLEAMHLCSASLPPDESEVERFDIETAPSACVRPPRIAAAPICFECRLIMHFPIGREPHVVFIGEVKHFYVRDDLYDGGRIDQALLQPIGRIGGPWYARLGEMIHMPPADSLVKSGTAGSGAR